MVTSRVSQRRAPASRAAALALKRCDAAGQDDLVGGIDVGDPHRIVGRRDSVGEGADGGRSQTQHSRHAPPTARADLLHEISAQPYRRHGLGEREHAGGDRGGEGSDRVPGDKDGYKAAVVGPGARRCHARDQQRQLDIGGRLQRLGGVQVGRRAGVVEFECGSSRVRVTAGEAGRARSMPGRWEP
jgi:hypothetical protein